MLIVAHKGRERQVMDIFKHWELDAVVIGRVTDTGNVQLMYHEGTVADIPVNYLTDEAPVYERPMRAPTTRDEGGGMRDESRKHTRD
jgi:phosphoribosylformylglycinamidine synthase